MTYLTSDRQSKAKVRQTKWDQLDVSHTHRDHSLAQISASVSKGSAIAAADVDLSTGVYHALILKTRYTVTSVTFRIQSFPRHHGDMQQKTEFHSVA